MYYRRPKEYLFPVVTGDINEEYIDIKKTPLKEECLVEKMALEEADKEFIKSEVKGYYSQGYFSEGYEYNLKSNEYIE